MARAGNLSRSVAFAAVILAALVAPSAASAASTPPGFFGIIPSGATTDAEYGAMARGGNENVRVIVAWPFIETAPGARDWTLYDREFGRAAAAGLTVLPTLFGTPTFYAAKPAQLPVSTAAQRQGWARFVGDVARRYGPGGQFWALNPTLPNLPVRDWQVWNEPNINEFVGGKSNPRRYASLVKATSNNLEAVDPGARLGLAGLFRRPREGTGVPMVDYLEDLYRVRGIKDSFDAVSVHPYSKKPGDVIRTLRQARAVIRDKRDDAAIWVTELGWATGGRGLARSPYQATPGQQAKKLTAAYRLLMRERKRLRLERVVWHVWRDSDTPPAFWTQYMGLFDTAGRPKPSWFAYTRITGGTP